MPRRNVVLADGEIYHVFNRSIAKENIFFSQGNLRKAIEIIEYYRFPQKLRLSKFKALPRELKGEYLNAQKNVIPLVEIYCFSFMPNHYHFLLKQLQDKGILQFISNFQNSFAKVFNLKNERDGALFQNSFKAKRIETEEQLVHVSRYIHLNPVTSYLIDFKNLANYSWTSFPMYLNGNSESFINTEFILKLFGTKEKYRQFVADQINFQRELAIIKDLIME